MSSASNLEQAFTVDPTVVIDQLPPREPTIEQPAVTTNALPRRRWSRSQKGVLWTLGVAIYGLAIANIFAWEDKNNREQMYNSDSVVTSTTTITPDLSSTTVPSLDFPPVTIPDVSTTTTTTSTTQAVETDASATPDTSTTLIIPSAP